MIVHVIGGLSRGGAENVLYRLLTAQADPSASHVVSLTDEGIFGEKLRAAGIGVTCLHMRAGVGVAKAGFTLLKLLKRLSPEMVQTWMYHADLFGGLVSRLAGVPVCWGIRNGDLEPERNKCSTRVVAKQCAWLSRFIPTQIVSCSTRASVAHREFGYAGRFVVIPNGVDLRLWEPRPDLKWHERDTLRIPQEAFLVGHASRADPQKDHSNLIAAFDRFASTEGSAHLLLAGAGLSGDDEYLRRLLIGRNHSARIRAVGIRDDLPHLFHALDVFVLSSAGEAFPNVVVEAMACGLPCVVTDVGDAAEIVGDTGWVVPPGDPQLLASALRQASNESPAIRAERGARARRRVEAKYDLAKMASAYRALWADVSSERTPQCVD